MVWTERQAVFMNVNTQQMRYFMELAKCLNFTRAAANLYVAQPTLSQQIAELEAQLGVSLFIRNSRSVSLTPAGKILYDAYPDIVAKVQQVQQHMLVTAAGFSGSLTIGFLNTFMDFIPMIMRDFKNAFPDISVKPVRASLNELHNSLKNHTIDVAFSLIQDFAMEEIPSFRSREILNNAMCFVLPAEYPVSSDFSFTETLPLITFSDTADSVYYPYVRARLKKLGIQVPEVIFTDSIENIRAYLESGTGFSILGSNDAFLFSESTQFLPIPEEHLEFGALWDPCSSNPALPLFLDTLDQFLENNPKS